MRKGGMAATLGGARKMRDAALAAVAGLFLLGALAGSGRRTSTELMSVAYGLLPISERVSFSQAAAQCPTTEAVRAGVWAAVCPTGDELMWCSRMADAVVDDVVDATKCEDDTCRAMAASPCAVACTGELDWWEVCSWQAVARFDDVCAGTFVPTAPDAAPVEGALYVPLADDGLDSCDSYAFCEACMSSVDARRSCASRLALTGGVVVAEIDGVAKEGYKHGGTAATALLLNAAEVCSARRLRRR